MNTVPQDAEQLRAAIRERYTQSVQGNGCCTSSATTQSSCCGTSCCGTGDSSPITSNLYSEAEVGTLPVVAVLASLGCGNPTALRDLRPGEKVLELGSGGGIDVLLSAQPVVPPPYAVLLG